MADFSNIIQEINTNLPDNTSQSITAAKLRTTLIDLTNQIDTVQDDFESHIDTSFGVLQGQVETALDNLVVDNLTSDSSTSALSANQGRVLNEKFDTIEYPEEITLNLNDYTVNSTATLRIIGEMAGKWDDTTYAYNRFIFIPINPNTKVSLKSPQSYSSQIAFLKSTDITIGELADYAGDYTKPVAIASGGTEASYYAPSDAAYLYVLYQQNDLNTHPDNRKPQWIKINQQLPYVKDSDIVNTLDSTDTDKVLSAALGPKIKPAVDAANSPTYISVLGGMLLNGVNIGISSAEPPFSWVYADGVRYSSVVPIKGIKKIRVTANAHSSHIAFLKTFEIPTNGLEELGGTLPDYAGELQRYNLVSSNSVVELDVPSDANFIYFNIQNTNDTQSYIPKEVLVTEQDESTDIVIPSWYDDYEYNTYIEENISDYYIRNQYMKEKSYIIDHSAEYCVIGYGLSTYGQAIYMITTYNSSNTKVRELYSWGGGTERELNMEPITFQDNEYKAVIRYYYTKNTSVSTLAHIGIGALMRKLKNDNWIPTNNIIYCVSKIKSPVMPYDYSEADTTFAQTDIWSAWGFNMPYNYNRNLFTNRKFPICTFFHGSSAWVSPDTLGPEYYQNPYAIMGKLRQLGFVVLDVNGYGINRRPSDTSRHWGNPRTVDTVKKAYEILVERFNCRRGMALSGISMGGAIAKSYALTYPEDVVCCALEAPSELGGTCRYNNPLTSSYQSAGSCARAWGYSGSTDRAAAEAMFADTTHAPFIGYSISVAPIVIDPETNGLSKINMSSYTESTTPNLMFGDNTYQNFMQPFPVETKIWQGDDDEQLPLRWNEMFVSTARNANSNVTLRLCPGCRHSLNNYPWVVDELLNYVSDKMKI